MSRLLLVSNRLPITIEKQGSQLQISSSVGGLATGLDSFYRSQESMWIGWPGIAKESMRGPDRAEISRRLAEERCVPVHLSRADLDAYYYGFSNNTIWPLFHYFTHDTVYDQDMWKAYVRVNRRFCEALLGVTEPGDQIWVHDYQLMLLPGMLRKELPDANVGFFLHIPFPSYEIFRLMPWRREILEGIIGADLIGFHTYDYVRHFLSAVRRLLGHEAKFSQIFTGRRIIRADIFPMGIDYERYAGAVEEPAVQDEIQRIRKEVGHQRFILSVDRLDYTKGILERLDAFDLFLENNPEYRENVTLILVAVPSRTGVDSYQELKRQIDERIGYLNGKYDTIGWVPIWYLYRSVPFETLVALYNLADVALVTPVRDGMNLIAKEFIAAKTDGRGVLVLSEMAGAAQELGEALTVNPNSREDVARALKDALTMPEEEQIVRNRRMQSRLQRYTVERWAHDFVERLAQTKKAQGELGLRELTSQIRAQLQDDYRSSRRRLLLLDYDGTLVSFVGKPERARPDEWLLARLEKLCADPQNHVVIVSGRDKTTLEEWLGHLPLSMIAEHGVWVRTEEAGWQTIEPLDNDWKDEIRPILELYVDRTPGSLLEEKEFSLVWHYRRASPELSAVRVTELRDAILNITGNLNLGVLEGNKVLEVKNSGINKGRTVMRWLAREDWDFILALGDDWTDEDTFAVLPDTAYSIKVGVYPSRARFNVPAVEDVRNLLAGLVG
jgi:trehalose 6-phosphate synthase/phosphatase